MARPSALYTPRPDLSSKTFLVEEFRVKAHDGLRLLGLHGRRAIGAPSGTVRIRIAPSDRPPELDLEALREGSVEYAFQFPEGRRLEDRVLDVLRVCQLAAAREGIAPRDVALGSDGGSELESDEFLIVSELLAAEVGGEDR